MYVSLAGTRGEGLERTLAPLAGAAAPDLALDQNGARAEAPQAMEAMGDSVLGEKVSFEKGFTSFCLLLQQLCSVDRSQAS